MQKKNVSLADSGPSVSRSLPHRKKGNNFLQVICRPFLLSAFHEHLPCATSCYRNSVADGS